MILNRVSEVLDYSPRSKFRGSKISLKLPNFNNFKNVSKGGKIFVIFFLKTLTTQYYCFLFKTKAWTELKLFAIAATKRNVCYEK